jgi:hypothetical protein
MEKLTDFLISLFQEYRLLPLSRRCDRARFGRGRTQGRVRPDRMHVDYSDRLNVISLWLLLSSFCKLPSPGEEFYALFYLGLFNEARGETTKAENYMKAAAGTKYAEVVGSQDYMVDCAKVHCKLRRWT